MQSMAAAILASVLLAGCASAEPAEPVLSPGAPVAPDPRAVSLAPTSRAEQRGSASTPTVLEVTCTPEGATSSTPLVAASAAGLRVRYSHPSTPDDGASGWSIAWQSNTGGAGFGGDPDGTTEVVLPLAPGRVSEVACSPPIGPDVSVDSGAERWKVRPEVVDPGGVWRPSDLDCEQTASTSIGDPTGGPRAEGARLARDALLGYFGSDVDEDEIEQLGYPDAPGPTYGVVRQGRVLARLNLDVSSPGSGSVFPNGFEHCELAEWSP